MSESSLCVPSHSLSLSLSLWISPFLVIPPILCSYLSQQDSTTSLRLP